MATVKSAFVELCTKNPGASIAAWLEPAGSGVPPAPTTCTLEYVVATDTRIPAAAYALDNLTDSRVVYTNLADDHWLWTYQADRFVRIDGSGNATTSASTKMKAWQKNTVDWTIAGTRARTGLTLKGTGASLPDTEGPIEGGGLYAKAKEAAAAPGRLVTGTGKDKALERALRYYQLGAYALVARAKFFGLEVGNYVGALLVSDTGRIIGWGVNSALYHHAEVNLMLKYFQARPGDTKLPAKTMVFTTLTPCKQCIGLLLSAKPTECEIFYGQYDSGDFGQQGAASSAMLDQKTKPVAIGTKTSASQPVVAESLSSTMGGGANIAARLGKNTDVVDLFEKIFEEVGRKGAKERDATDAEQKIKAAVLKHIEQVLGAVKI